MLTPDAGAAMPFTIPDLDRSRGFVHVFDEVALDRVFTTLDTVADVVRYFTKRERFIRSGRLGGATGEDDLLAFYMLQLDQDGEHSFEVANRKYDSLFIDESWWSDFESGPQRQAYVAANRISYTWDRLVEKFLGNVMGGTLYSATHPKIVDQERMFRLLARESRLRRRSLSEALINLLETTPHNFRAARVCTPLSPGEPYVLFLLLPQLESVSDSAYRAGRQGILHAYLGAVKYRYKDALDIVGIATEPGLDYDRRSEDVAYLDARLWSEEHEEQARRDVTELGLLREVTGFRTHVVEYPVPDAPNPPSTHRLARNAKCYCGSGKKFKRCHGARL
jgi:hypothetical protein